MAHDGDRRTGGASETVSGERERVLFAFAGFCLLFGQPVVVFALAMTTPGPESLAVIVGGTVLLAATAARVFVRQDRSVGRLGDFILALAAVQLALVAPLHLLLRAADLQVAAARPAIVLAAYPLAYYAVYRGAPVSLFTLGREE